MPPEQLDAIFKAYDIRGTVPDQLDADDRPRDRRRVRPVRRRAPRAGRRATCAPSGPELAAAFADGVRREGVDVVDLGLASTDLVYFAAGRLDAPARCSPRRTTRPQYNGIKLCLAGARPVGEESGLAEIKATPQRCSPTATRGAARGAESTRRPARRRSSTTSFSFIDVDALRPLKVVADTANGMGGLDRARGVRAAARSSSR